MSDQVPMARAPLPPGQARQPRPRQADTNGTDCSRMIPVTAEVIAGMYLPAIPGDSEDRRGD